MLGAGFSCMVVWENALVVEVSIPQSSSNITLTPEVQERRRGNPACVLAMPQGRHTKREVESLELSGQRRQLFEGLHTNQRMMPVTYTAEGQMRATKRKPVLVYLGVSPW